MVLTCSLLFACGPGRSPVDNETQADTASQDTFSGAAKKIVDWTGALANFFTMYQAIDAIGMAIGLINDPNTDIMKELSALSAKIDAIAGEISWYVAESDREQRLGVLLGDVTSSYDALNAGQPRDWTTIDADTVSAIEWAMQPAAFLAIFNDGKRFTPEKYDIRVGWYAWWQVVQSTDADLQYNNKAIWGEDGTYALSPGYGYDWRMGVPALLQLIGLRIQLMAMEDPSFTTDHRFDSELTQYHDALVKHLGVMNAGLRCNILDRSTADWGTNYLVSCADIYTGLDATSVVHMGANWYVSGQSYDAWYAANIQPTIDINSRTVRNKEPQFGIQAMIDTLYLFTHPQTDLTDRQGRIAAFANTGLCLDVTGANPTSGTAVWLWPCYGGNAQHWFYNRETQKIVNPAFGKCLDVRGMDPTPGAAAQIWDCIDNDDAQRWSYSHEDHGLRNALGNSLDVRGGLVAQQSTVWTWPFFGGPGQKWFADP
jgi:hypothetical protein